MTEWVKLSRLHSFIFNVQEVACPLLSTCPYKEHKPFNGRDEFLFAIVHVAQKPFILMVTVLSLTS